MRSTRRSSCTRTLSWVIMSEPPRRVYVDTHHPRRFMVSGQLLGPSLFMTRPQLTTDTNGHDGAGEGYHVPRTRRQDWYGNQQLRASRLLSLRGAAGRWRKDLILVSPAGEGGRGLRP